MSNGKTPYVGAADWAEKMGILPLGSGLGARTLQSYAAQKGPAVSPIMAAKQQEQRYKNPTGHMETLDIKGRQLTPGIPIARQPQYATVSSGSGGTTKQKTVYDPELRKQDIRLTSQQVTNVREMAKIKAQQAQQEYQATVQSKEARDKTYQQETAKVKAQEAKIEGQRAKLKGLYEEASKWKPDPERWWSQKGVGGKIAWALMSGISAGAAQTPQGFYTIGQRPQVQGGPGVVAQMMNKFIQQDLDLQEKEMKQKEKVRGEERNMLEFMYRKLGDMKQARSALDAKMREDAADVLRGIAMQTQSPLIKVQAEQQAATLAQGSVRRELDMTKEQVSKRRQWTTRRAPVEPQAGTAKMPKEAMQKLKAAKEAGYREKTYREGLGKYATGVAGRAVGEISAAVPYIATKAKYLKGQRGNIVSLHVKALSGVTARPDEIARIDPLYPDIRDSPKMRRTKFLRMLNERKQSLLSTVQTYPNAREVPLFAREIQSINDQIKELR